MIEIPGKQNNIDQTNESKVQIHSAFTAETQFLVDDQLKSIRSLYISSKVFPIFSLNGNKSIVQSHIMPIPVEMAIDTLYDVVIEGKFHIRCAPSTIFLTKFGWKTPPTMSVGISSVTKIIFSAESGVHSEEAQITAVDKKFSLIREPIYSGISEYQNFLLPYTEPASNNKILSFICIKQ